MARRFNPQTVIPGHWHGVYANSVEDLENYGRPLLAEMLRHWEEAWKEAKLRADELETMIDFLADKGREDLLAAAEIYRAAEYSSTLERCGCCKFRNLTEGIGIHCALLPPAFNNGRLWLYPDGFCSTDRCRIMAGTEELLVACLRYLRSARESAQDALWGAARKIGFLERMLERSEDKPLLPMCRPEGWIRTADEVYCLADDVRGEPRFRRGIVTGVETRMMWVGFLDETDLQGAVKCLSYYSPEVLFDWEYSYLREHAEFLDMWLSVVESEYLDRFDVRRFRRAIEHGDLAVAKHDGLTATKHDGLTATKHDGLAVTERKHIITIEAK